MTILSLAHASVIDASPLELIELARFAGFDAYGPRIVPPMRTDKIIEVVSDKNLQHEMKKRADDLGIFALDIEAFWLDEFSDIEALRPALETGAFLGARNLLVMGNDADQARLDENFAALAEMAAEYGLKTMLEFLPYTKVQTLHNAAEILRRTRPKDAGILVDALHLSRSGGVPEELALYPSEWFSYVHLCDAKGPPPSFENLRHEARTQRRYPGDGDLPLEALLRALPKISAIAVEVPSEHYAGLAPADKVKLIMAKTKEVRAAAFPDIHSP